MVTLISRQRGGLAAIKLTKLFGIDDFPAAKDSGKVMIIVYCYLIIIIGRDSSPSQLTSPQILGFLKNSPVPIYTPRRREAL